MIVSVAYASNLAKRIKTEDMWSGVYHDLVIQPIALMDFDQTVEQDLATREFDTDEHADKLHIDLLHQTVYKVSRASLYISLHVNVFRTDVL